MSMTRAERRRQEKALSKEPVYYQYTASQIEMIKRQAVAAKEAEIRSRVKEDVVGLLESEWKRREDLLNSQNDEERVLEVLSLLMSVPARILVDKFHWLPVRDENDRRSKLLQFSEAVVDEVNRIFSNGKDEIERYVNETHEKCGVKYTVKGESEEDETET